MYRSTGRWPSPITIIGPAHTEQAYRWALHAADAAGAAGGAAEMLRLLRRALDLLPEVTDPGASRRDLLHRIRVAAERSGRYEEELAAIDELLPMVDREREPLLASELLVQRSHMLMGTGQGFFDVAQAREAQLLSSAYPRSAQHALATAELAHAELWHDEPAGQDRAREAVRLGRACGSDRSLSYALTVGVMARCFVEDFGDDLLPQAREAQAAAARSRDFWAYVHATLWGANAIELGATRPVLAELARGREELAAMGAPHVSIARMCAIEANILLILGDWRACAERLRVVLGSTPGALADAEGRLTAAQLACRQGRWAEARAHLTRAEEIFGEQSGYLVLTFDAVRAELAVATGDVEGAVSSTLAGVAQDVAPDQGEHLAPVRPARALADQAGMLRDRGQDPSAVVHRLTDLRRRHPRVTDDPARQPAYGAQMFAAQTLYDAEVLRGQDHPDAAAAWVRAADACGRGELRWDEAYARWRVAQALLPSRSQRRTGVDALRRAYDLAEDLQAVPLLAELTALAGAARVSLTRVPLAEPVGTVAVLPGLTARECEILGYLVAGRTYAEIAHTLVISEKTVSVPCRTCSARPGPPTGWLWRSWPAGRSDSGPDSARSPFRG